MQKTGYLEILKVDKKYFSKVFTYNKKTTYHDIEKNK